MTQYQNPLTDRYASKEMSYIFSSDFKFKNWRKLWIALAEAEKKLKSVIFLLKKFALKLKEDNCKIDTTGRIKSLVDGKKLSYKELTNG